MRSRRGSAHRLTRIAASATDISLESHNASADNGLDGFDSHQHARTHFGRIADSTRQERARFREALLHIGARTQAICSTDEWVISALELLGICVVRHLAVMISRMWTFGSCKLAADQCVRNNGGGRYAVASRPRAPNRVAPTRGWDGLR